MLTGVTNEPFLSSGLPFFQYVVTIVQSDVCTNDISARRNYVHVDDAI